MDFGWQSCLFENDWRASKERALFSWTSQWSGLKNIYRQQFPYFTIQSLISCCKMWYQRLKKEIGSVGSVQKFGWIWFDQSNSTFPRSQYQQFLMEFRLRRQLGLLIKWNDFHQDRQSATIDTKVRSFDYWILRISAFRDQERKHISDGCFSIINFTQVHWKKGVSYGL